MRTYILKLVTSLLFGLTALSLLSCSSGSDESDIAKNIVFTTSKRPLVLQNFLSNVLGQTCIAGGVTGPRTRLRASIEWKGEGDLLPMVILLSSTDKRLTGDIKATISPGGDTGAESLALLFSLTTDYIPTGTTAVTTDCFLDYGGLPKPKIELKGAATLEVPVSLQINGVVRNSEGEDTPFVKEISTTILYVAGSVPIN